MIYVVYANERWEPRRTLTVTNDEGKALAVAEGAVKSPTYNERSEIERWDAATGEIDIGYLREFWNND